MDIMESCKVILVFNILEILVMISQYLTSHDMAMTMATCKNLSRQLEPILWKHLKDAGWDELQSRQLSLILEDLKNSGDSSGPFRSNITSLTLPTYDTGYPLSFVEPLLKDHLSNIERLTIPMLDRYGNNDEGDEDPEAIQAMEEAIHGLCPKLQHLTIMFDDSNHDISYLRLFISEFNHGGIGLKSYRAYNQDDDTYFDTLETLIDYHFDTLEEVELIDCVVARSENLQYIFTCCKNLRRFWATPGDGGSVELSFADISREEWVCLEMRELRLNLILDDTNNVSYDKAGVASMAKKAYARIGQLVKLEKLSLGCYFDRYVAAGYQLSRNDLTLKHGFLAELAGLSKLRHFHMFTDFWSKMGKAEVKFIHEHWTCLERITFGEDNIVSRAALDQPHWRWLKEQRPGLIFDYDDYDNYD
ncbi:hypothetical protein BGZ80_005993 [Entomortierella chlamydospora]|uniref:F-box domain-containing protein n=1 Tax=Entomortierella chlamydospora TaxID=101097 RepID=A0A9P6MIL5_9FUNG|nr:hypothetical protein BGZ80_005993 [Entomortierella chlamydospora]